MGTQKKRRQRGGTYSVTYAGREADGSLRPRSNTLAPPSIHYPEADPEDLYSLIIWDPDAPHNPSYLHWLVMNIPADQIDRGSTILPYTPPTPPPCSGVHRYYVGLYKQPSQISVGQIKRTGFSIDSFTGLYGLDQVGIKLVKVSA